MIGDRIMNKVLINSNIHDGAASIAKPSTPKFTETTEFKEALAYVETMVSKVVSQYHPMRMVWMPWWR